MRITIDLDEESAERPRGVLRWQDQHRRFDGWLELLRLLETLVATAGDAGVEGPGSEPGTKVPGRP